MPGMSTHERGMSQGVAQWEEGDNFGTAMLCGPLPLHAGWSARVDAGAGGQEDARVGAQWWEKHHWAAVQSRKQPAAPPGPGSSGAGHPPSGWDLFN
jgi:hypothetical protein